jgi:hypothetical protein
VLGAKVQHLPSAGQGLGGEHAVGDHEVAELALPAGIGPDIVKDRLGSLEGHVDDGTPQVRVSRVEADDQSIDGGQQRFLLGQEETIGLQRDVAEPELTPGAEGQGDDVRVEKGIATRQDEAIHATADHREHPEGILQWKWQDSLGVSSLTEILTVGAIEVALPGHIVRDS